MSQLLHRLHVRWESSTGAGLFVLAAVALWSSDAHAYRPFDGTDADVADVGEFELELGPAHLYREGEHHYLIAPATVLNLGVVPNVELVADFRGFVGFEQVADQSRVRVLDTDVLLKWILRRGVIQGESGLSVALEAGPLVPEIGGEHAFGAQADLITSHRWSGGTLHFNEQAALSRAGHLDVFSSVILEGPNDLVVRPVAEVFVDHDFDEGTTVSALFGAIWTLSDDFTLDVGLRAAELEDEPVQELRLGFTWAVPVWAPKGSADAKNAALLPRFQPPGMRRAVR